MTVTTTANSISYAGNGTTKAFAFPYIFFAPSDLVVTLVDTATNAVVGPPSTLNGGGIYDYTVTGVLTDGVLTHGEYASGGTVTLNTAPPANLTVVLVRAAPAIQTVTLIDNAKFPATTVNTEFDYLTVLIQQALAGVVGPPGPQGPPGSPVLRVRVFTASGTYTPTVNMVSGYVVGIGGGGQAGGYTAVAGVSQGSGGGASGNTMTTYFVRAEVQPTVAVTIGAGGSASGSGTGATGGDTIFGSLLRARGGLGGTQFQGGPPNTPTNIGSVISWGFPGGNGMQIGFVTTTLGVGGNGGGPGGGLGGVTAGAAAAGAAGIPNSGGGGGGTATVNQSGTVGGSAGGSGYLYVVEYCSA